MNRFSAYLLTLKKIKIENVTKKSFQFLKLFLYFSIVSIVIGFIVLIVVEVRKDSLEFGEFSMPLALTEKGFTSEVLKNKVEDNIIWIRHRLKSTEEYDEQEVLSNSKEMDFDIGSTGLSLKKVISIIKLFVGKSNKTVSGDVLVINEKVLLTNRITNQLPIVHSYMIDNNNEETILNELALHIAEDILQHTEPLLLISHLRRTKEYEKEKEIINYCLYNGTEQQKLWALHFLSLALIIDKNYEEAIEKSNLAIQEDENFLPAYIDIIQATTKTDSIKAMKLYQETETKFGVNSKLNNYLARYFYIKKNYTRAIEESKKVIEVAPNDYIAYARLGICYKKVKDTISSLENYKKSIAINSSYSTSHNNLSVLYMDLKKYVEAKEHALRATQIDPFSSIYYRTLAMAYCCNKQYKDAIEAADRALKMKDKKMYLSTYIKAVAYEALENKEEFYLQLKEAVKQKLTWDDVKTKYTMTQIYERYKDDKKFLEIMGEDKSKAQSSDED
jgi:tetratricopeptide (TPR) repeat protein